MASVICLCVVSLSRGKFQENSELMASDGLDTLRGFSPLLSQ